MEYSASCLVFLILKNQWSIPKEVFKLKVWRYIFGQITEYVTVYSYIFTFKLRVFKQQINNIILYYYVIGLFSIKYIFASEKKVS